MIKPSCEVVKSGKQSPGGKYAVRDNTGTAHKPQVMRTDAASVRSEHLLDW